MKKAIRSAMPAYSVGIDLGGSQVRAALVDEGGRILSRAAEITDKINGPMAVVDQMIRLVQRVSQGVELTKIAAIGLSAPGPLDAKAGVVLNIPTLPGWTNVPITQILSDRLQLPVILENDGVAAAVGEWVFGAATGESDFIYVTVSTGIGGGIIADGRILRGNGYLAGHIGHMTLDPHGPMCQCGNRGCWEALASGTSLGHRARSLVSDHSGSSLSKLPGNWGAREVFEAAASGDSWALELVEQESRYLAMGMVGLLHIFSTTKFVIGGGVSSGFDLMRSTITEYIQSYAMPEFRRVTVQRAALGVDSGLIGACVIGSGLAYQ